MKKLQTGNTGIAGTHNSETYLADEILYAVKGFDGRTALYFSRNTAGRNPSNYDRLSVEYFETMINRFKEIIAKERKNYELLCRQLNQ